MAKKYVVKPNDSLWQIAKDNHMSLEELIKLNPSKKNMIHPNDVLRLEPDKITKDVDIRKERQLEDKLNLSNITAIQGYKHDSNYVIIDKKNRKLTVYDKNNKPLYTTSDFATGLSGNDYNTVTYVDENGKIKNNAGNNSTPAGILEISGKGTYHGFPSFTRARINRDGTKEDVASSFHWGNIGKNKNASNGCVRIGGKTLCDIAPLLSVGTRIYTLPEKEGSKFSLKGGKLNFTADNPYGQTEGDKRFWDDYNTSIDKSYSPLKLVYHNTGNKQYDNNRHSFAQSIVNNKRKVQKEFGLTSDEYNRLAELALGIAEQESKFGTGNSLNPMHNYILKKYNPGLVDFFNGRSAVSRGYTQIKIDGDNKELQKLYKDNNIDFDNILQGDKSALATMIRLAYIYNNEVRGRKFLSADGNQLSPYHVLMYKWNGKNDELKNRTATPADNNYIRNVEKYSRNFDMYETRTYNQYKYGGKLSLEDI